MLLHCSFFSFLLSVTSQSVGLTQKRIKSLKISGLSTKDKNYNYYKQFSYITVGKPAGKAKALLAFLSSENGKAIMKKEGVCPSCVD